MGSVDETFVMLDFCYGFKFKSARCFLIVIEISARRAL